MTPQQTADLIQLTAERDSAQTTAEYYQSRISSTLDRYGDGVRPSWVSEDIALDGAARDRWQAEADALTAQIDDMKKIAESN